MRWRTHLLVGALVAEGVVSRTHPGLALGAGCLAAAELASVVPDVDHLGAILHADFPGSSLGHRTVTHSLPGLVAAAWLVRLVHLPAPVALAWAFAWAGHLAADLLTPAGCPLLWPMPWRPSLKLCRTGGALETWVVWPALAALVVVTGVGILC